MRSLLVLRGALGMFCLVGLCAAEAQAQPGLSAGQRATVSGQLALGVALVRDIGGKAGAVSLSPYSVHSAVSLARIGASGATAQELDRLLGVGGGPDAEQSSYGPLNQAVFSGSDPDTVVALGNSIWLSSAITPRPAFLAGASESFGALARTVDFADPAVKDEINGWVRGITNGLIPELLKARLDPSTLAALVNSLYLKAAWVNQFDKEATHDGSYWISESESIQHPLMHDTVFNRGYYEDKEWQAAAFPLAKGRFKFTVLLPRARRSAKSISAGLSVGLLNKALMAERSQKLEVTLPTMKVRARPDVEAYLRARAPGAFGPKADFSALAQEPVRISSVVHETVVSLDEKGVEAAAATAIIMVASAAPFGKADEPVLFTVDRPFVYVITHAETGAPLFLGVVGDPRES